MWTLSCYAELEKSCNMLLLLLLFIFFLLCRIGTPPFVPGRFVDVCTKMCWFSVGFHSCHGMADSRDFFLGGLLPPWHILARLLLHDSDTISQIITFF